MRRFLNHLLTAGLGALACALAAQWLAGGTAAVRTEDHNHDGRPDVWRVYDTVGRLASAAFDTNYDGRADVQEYYSRGVLVRREADRDFNHRIDLIQDFDATTQVVRTVVDRDFDGVADVFELFRGGVLVLAKSRSSDAAPRPARHVGGAADRTGDQTMLPLYDPFVGAMFLAQDVMETAPDDCLVQVRSSLPPPCLHLYDCTVAASSVWHAVVSRAESTIVFSHPHRGPPIPLQFS